MRPFNLEKAADGEPVMTKNGLPARVICVDANNPWEGVDENLCVIALVKKGGLEQLHRYNEKGEYRSTKKNCMGDAVVEADPSLDLVMRTRKREGWVNVYACTDEHQTGVIIYQTPECARENAAAEDYVDTVKIEWEE